MRIECPNCHLTGNVNEEDLSSKGRRFDCPRCKTGFHVDMPSPGSAGRNLMSMCPICQYSTFTDEMFSVCPKCGTTGSDYRIMLLKKSEQNQQRQESTGNSQEPPPTEPDQEQMMREYELLTRSLRNPDFEVEEPDREKTPKSPLSGPIRVTGWTALITGAIFLCIAVAGLMNYYGKDWQTILSSPLLEPASKVEIFFKFGFSPWLQLLFSICFIGTASGFLALRRHAPTILAWLSWGGIALVLTKETISIINRILISSGSPSLIFLLDCLISLLITASFWSSPFLAIILLLRRESTLQDYPSTNPVQQGTAS